MFSFSVAESSLNYIFYRRVLKQLILIKFGQQFKSKSRAYLSSSHNMFTVHRSSDIFPRNTRYPVLRMRISGVKRWNSATCYINFMIINNSFSVTMLTKMHEIACLATYIFNNFRRSIRTHPLRLASFVRIASPFNLYAACHFFYLTHMKNSSKNSDQISGRHWSRHCTMVALFICISAS